MTRATSLNSLPEFTSGDIIIALANEKPGGVNNDDLLHALPEIQPELRVQALNKLLQEGVLELLKKGQSLLYRLKDPTKKSTAPKDIDNEEKIIYNIIEEGGNKGIWIRDIRVKSNLIMTQLNKVLKQLENKKLIKAVKSVNASKKKVYMLYNLEPDRSITGGAWYQDQDFEAEFVDVLNQQCLRFLRMKRETAKECRDGPLAVQKLSYCSVADVHKFISDLGISKISLDEDDLETILRTVVYDGKAESIPTGDGKFLYKAIESPLSSPGLVQMPCGICPVIKHCSDCGEITPKLCSYISEWLD
ncbi:probable DNA-directed RNA polymerase III subunit RPC6 isoform X2 [Malaya genurostris]|uniref:probable DNA-directed RNA polymerase III subunit RPC6 isoform X2 n=1 Tax=Malaya genurostris TaxID=325434 RepID=UPI0026F3C325|nr:probable DNA-directed RNA polymerase III subunit RPC6 isoform X2 [Malaya genurostris]